MLKIFFLLNFWLLWFKYFHEHKFRYHIIGENFYQDRELRELKFLVYEQSWNSFIQKLSFFKINHFNDILVLIHSNKFQYFSA